MDSLDIKIFLAMGTRNYLFQGEQNRHLNLKLIAKELDVDPDTVRARIRKMEESGFIKYYQVFPNYRIFGLHCFAVGLIFPEIAAKKEALRKLKLIENVAWVDERLHSLRVLLLYQTVETDLERNLALIEELTGTKPVLENNLEMLPIGIKLGQMDWQIIKSIRYDARKATEQVAKELCLTTRGVNYRLQRLVKGNAFFIVPVVSLEDFFCSHFTVFLDEDKRAAAVNEIDRLIQEKCMSRLVGSEGSVTFCVLTKSVNESEEDYFRMKAIPGVKRAIMDFTQCSHDTSAYFDKLINKKNCRFGKNDQTRALKQTN
jgi:DNA-binding Lrp family transcriptional regulator